jgi:hypothetical protein
VTDSSDPKAPKSSRKKHAREPATIDLKATVLDDGAKEADETSADTQDNAWQNVRPEETIITEPDTLTGAAPEDAVTSPEASLDSGTGTDSIAPEAAESETSSRDDRLETVLPHTPAPERRNSAAALIGSGVLGGLIGAGLVYGFQVWQQPTTVQDSQRLAQLEQRVSALGQGGASGQSVNLQPIEGRLQALESARGPIDQRIQQAQGIAEGAAARAEEALNRPQSAPQNDAVLTDVSNRLAALENQLRAEAQSAAGAVNSVQGSVQSLDQRVGQQDQRLVALSQQVTENSRGVENASQTSIRVVLSERLGEALRGGTPYADLLVALRKNGANAERLAALEPFAQSGAPTANDLLSRYEPLEKAILRDQRAASGEWSDRLLRMMENVVTVRPVNEPGATGVSSTLARIRQTLAQGDMGGTAAAWHALPEPARRMSEEWGNQVTALAKAEQASRELSAESLAALNRSTQ